jgi:hypothetical protein
VKTWEMQLTAIHLWQREKRRRKRIDSWINDEGKEDLSVHGVD